MKKLPDKLAHLIRLRINDQYALNFERKKELKRISSMPRYTEAETMLLGKKILFPDSASFVFIYNELFTEGIYKFTNSNERPYIIDCGANIGLSVIYFKQLYPDAEIIAFEPDEKVFKALQYNVESFSLKNIQLIKKACWNEETTLQFYSEGADGGRAAMKSDAGNLINVDTTRLGKYLDRKVDFLKIDIEGAENEVIIDIKNQLPNVERIFVEYHSFVGKEQMLPEILAILKEAGFRLHISSPGLVSKSPFVKLNSYADMDNQLNIYAFRVN